MLMSPNKGETAVYRAATARVIKWMCACDAIRLTMLCFSGFELCSRWVPLFGSSRDEISYSFEKF